MSKVVSAWCRAAWRVPGVGGHARRGRLLLAVLLTVGLVMAQTAGPAHASSSKVADCTFATLQADLQLGGDWYYDSGQCAGNTTANTIPFTGPITISSNASLTSNGSDIILSGGGAAQFFVVKSGVSFGLNGLTLSHNSYNPNSVTTSTSSGGAIHNGGTLSITNSTLSGNSSYEGGAIYNGGTLTITGSTLSGNSASGDGGLYGGAIYNAYGGTVHVTNSTLTGNSGGDGGAIYNGSTVTITNSTLTGNSASGGGAISNQSGTLTITNSTLSGNSGPFGGGAIYNRATVHIASSTLSGNSAPNGAGGAVDNVGRANIGSSIIANSTSGGNCSGGITDSGYNVESGTDCGFTGTGSVQNADPELLTLANNGGPTQTMALQSGSPARDRIPSASCQATDQRGYTRPGDGGAYCDSGAYEYQITTVTDCPTTETALSTDIGNAPGAIVTFNCTSPTTIHFDSGHTGGTGSPISVSQNVTLDGSNSAQVTFDGGGSTGLFSVSSGGVLSLKGFTLSHGHVGSSSNGGAISNSGTLTIADSTLSSSSAGNFGGAIFNDKGSTATLSGSTLTGNSAPSGGGIFNAGTMHVTNSTFSGNSASSYGGAFYNALTLSITSSTFSGNSATNGGGVVLNYGTTTISGSILANSTSGGNCSIYGFTVTDNGYNLEWSGAGHSDTCGFSSGTDITGQDPKLRALANNGGPTQTMALQSGSPAIDRVPSAACPATDQRGNTRPDNGEASCDIGAYEYQITSVTDCPTTQAALITDIGNAPKATVTFNCTSPTTIYFDSGHTGGTGSPISVSQDVTLDGSNSAQVTLDGGSKTRLFAVSGALSLKGLTLSHGKPATGTDGGAISSSGTLSITDSTLSGNSAVNDGGAIYSTGTLSITGSTLSGNHSGAIDNAGTMHVTNSTFSGNSAPYGGGAILNDSSQTHATITGSTFSGNSATSGDGGAFYNDGTLTITNSTLSGNSAGNFGGGGIYNYGTVHITSSTLSGNSGPSGGAIYNVGTFGGTVTIGSSIIANGASGGNCSGSGITDSGYNLEWSGTGHSDTCGFSSSTDITGQDPKFDSAGLAGNGSSEPQTIALQQGSPAIDVIPAASCAATDERGITRPDDSESACDIGAYEYDGTDTPPASSTTLTVGTASGPYGGATILTATLTSGGTGVIGKTITFSLNGVVVGTATTADGSNGTTQGVATLTGVSLGTISPSTYPSSGTSCNATTSSDGVFATFAGDTSDLTSSSCNTLTVRQADQATLTVTGPSTGTYGQALKLTSGGGSGTGAVTYDVGSSTACTIPTSGPNAGMLVITSGTGSCAVTATKAADTNYTSTTSASATVTVTKATLTITPTHNAISYGDPAPTDGWGYTPSDFVNGDNAGTTTITGNPSGCSTSYVQGNEPGSSYAITCTDSSGMSAANYTFTFATGSLTVGTRAITVTASDAGYTYGDTPPASYGGTVTAGSLAGTDSLSNLGVTCSPVDSSSTPFTPTATTAAGQYTIVCSGGSRADYSYTYLPGTLTVAQRPITVQAGSPASQTYGATSAPTVDCTPSGFVGLDSFSKNPAGAVYDASGATSVTIGSGSNAGSYTTECSGGAVGSNYTIQGYVAGSFTISPASLTITASGGTMTYGGTVPTITPSYDGFVNGDLAKSLSTGPTCSTVATSSSGVGQYASSCSGAAGSNYSISYTNGSVTVSPAALAVTAPSPTMTYGDTTLPSLAPSSVTGLKNNDTFGGMGGSCSPLTSSGTAFTLSSSTNAGTYTVRCSGVSSGNYTVKYADGTLTVNKAPLTITASSASVTYTGSVPAITPSYKGFIPGESSTSLTTLPTCGSTAPISGAAGNYATSCSGAVDANYQISYIAGSLAIAKAQTGTSLSSSLNPSMSSQSVTLTATMSVTAPGAGTPTGTVTFLDGSTKLGSGTLTTSNGVTRATFSTSTLALGSRSVTATYNGDGNFVGSSSVALTQNVDTSLSSYPKLASGAYNLQNAPLSGAYLVLANLAGANATNATLTNANLTSANLSGANLSQANLSGAIMSKANLTNANLSQANLKGATGLSTATLTGVIWSKTTCPDGTLSTNDGGTCAGHL